MFVKNSASQLTVMANQAWIRGLRGQNRWKSIIKVRSMSPASAISLSGMNAAQAALDTSAHNIANLATPGFRRREVVQSTLVDGGVTTSQAEASEAGPAIEADVVGQLVSKNAFLANLAVFRASNKMLGALLDEES